MPQVQLRMNTDTFNTDSGQKQQTQVDELAALVRRLAHSLRKAAPDNGLSCRALGYLTRQGLSGAPVRMDLHQITEPRVDATERDEFEVFWVSTRGRRATRDLVRHILQPKLKDKDKAHWHLITWRAARAEPQITKTIITSG